VKAIFICIKHEVYLDGHPLWKLDYDSDPEAFSVSLIHMRCPAQNEEISCSEDNWKIEIIQ